MPPQAAGKRELKNIVYELFIGLFSAESRSGYFFRGYCSSMDNMLFKETRHE
jgi:hypothetical protein